MFGSGRAAGSGRVATAEQTRGGTDCEWRDRNERFAIYAVTQKSREEKKAEGNSDEGGAKCSAQSFGKNDFHRALHE